MFEFGQMIQCLDTFCFIILDGLLSAYERNLIKGSWNQFKTTRQWLITRCFYYLLKTNLKCNIGPVTYKCPLSLNNIYFIKMMLCLFIPTKNTPILLFRYVSRWYRKNTNMLEYFFSFDYFNRYITDFVNFTILLYVYLYVAYYGEKL